MNQTIENLIKHVSVRDFKDETISENTKEELVKAAQSGSTSEFVQAFSIIEITDPDLRNQLSDITISSPHVKKADTFYVFVADLNRQATMLKQHNQSLDSIKNMESLLVATVDTTIAALSYFHISKFDLAIQTLEKGIKFALSNNSHSMMINSLYLMANIAEMVKEENVGLTIKSYSLFNSFIHQPLYEEAN